MALFDRLIKLLDAGPTHGSEVPSEQLATAVLLVEMARSDFQFDEVERDRIRALLGMHFQLPPAEVERLIDQALQRAQKATSLYDYVKVLNERLAPDGKLRLMELLWGVAYADGHVDKYEEHLMRKLGDLLYVPTTDYVRAKFAASGGEA